ncbi:hypothetical protein PsorP6_013377 [Peronosclerospora sorghi]|uniref:Uncharacterized protein n=1 Tax=Peronosclerospora sorghi TaxID=230839 RepID=A0ACC0WI11_9STRA|nr:hypothetical protein PsorP6_013377 [Peronosclerospora sorghi]
MRRYRFPERKSIEIQGTLYWQHFGDTDHTATPSYVEFLADIWVINRSGLDLIYGTAADSEAYIPPPAARTRVGNAQISAYSSEHSGKIPVKRMD